MNWLNRGQLLKHLAVRQRKQPSPSLLRTKSSLSCSLTNSLHLQTASMCRATQAGGLLAAHTHRPCHPSTAGAPPPRPLPLGSLPFWSPFCFLRVAALSS